MNRLIQSLFTLSRRGLHKPPAVSSSGPTARRAAFSLIELMSVMAVVTLITGLSVPALKGLNGANVVDASASRISGLLSFARSEAIAQHTIVRFVVAADRSGRTQDASPHRMSLWAWHADVGRYLQLTNWEELPAGIILERDLPGYIRAAQYATEDASTVRGSSVLDINLTDPVEFLVGTDAEPISGRFIEFLPSGSARIPNSTERRAIFVATQGFADARGNVTHTSQANGRPTNWAQVNVDTLTGRVRVYRP